MWLYITKLFLSAVSEISATSGITNHACTRAHIYSTYTHRRSWKENDNCVFELSSCAGWESGSLMEKNVTYSLVLFISCFLLPFPPFFSHLQSTACHTNTVDFTPFLLAFPLIYLPLPSFSFPLSFRPPLVLESETASTGRKRKI